MHVWCAYACLTPEPGHKGKEHMVCRRGASVLGSCSQSPFHQNSASGQWAGQGPAGSVRVQLLIDKFERQWGWS